MTEAKLKPWFRPLWRRFYEKQSVSRPIWSGIYSSFDQVPSVGPGFKGHRFASQTQDVTRALLESTRTREIIPRQTSGENSFLPLLVSMAGENAGEVAILDFGGGTGSAFVNVISSSSVCSNIKFHVVETASACRLGEELFADEPRIRFHSALPEGLGPVDIVHIASALQYVDDYRKMLVDLCSFRARYFLLVNLSAAAIPTYATAQQVYDDMVVPYWFLNLDEVIDILASQSYHLLWKGSSQREFDQSNFPPEYRMGHTCNLLFRQDGKRI